MSLEVGRVVQFSSGVTVIEELTDREVIVVVANASPVANVTTSPTRRLSVLLTDKVIGTTPPTTAEPLVAVAASMPTVIVTICGSIQSGIDGGPAIGPLGIAGPTPIIHSPSDRYIVVLGSVLPTLDRVLTLKPVGELANISTSSAVLSVE